MKIKRIINPKNGKKLVVIKMGGPFAEVFPEDAMGNIERVEVPEFEVTSSDDPISTVEFMSSTSHATTSTADPDLGLPQHLPAQTFSVPEPDPEKLAQELHIPIHSSHERDHIDDQLQKISVILLGLVVASLILLGITMTS